MPAPAAVALLSLGGSRVRPRPVLAIRIAGPGRTWLRDGLLDTGSDETVFEDRVAAMVGLDLSGAEEREVALVGRPRPIRCRYAPVRLRITDGHRETYEWTAVVAFASTRLAYALLGYAGFLQFFDAEFRGADRAVVLTP